jgi:hypothetical protein
LQSAGFATEYLDISNGVVTILARNPIDESA